MKKQKEKYSKKKFRAFLGSLMESINDKKYEKLVLEEKK